MPGPTAPGRTSPAGTGRVAGRPPLPGALRRFCAASGVSSLGDGACLTAAPLLAASLTRDPLQLSLVSAAALLPWLFSGLVGGALVDRWDRRRTLWTTDAVRAVLVLTGVALAATGWIGIGPLAALAFLLSAGRILFDTAAAAYLPELVRGEPELPRRARVRLRATTDVTEGVAGPLAGAALFTLGRTVPLVAAALSFLFSALVIRSLPPGAPAPRGTGSSALKDARAGALYLVRDPLLLGLALRSALCNLAFAAGTAVFVLFAQEELGLGPVGIGVLLAVEAAGCFFGSLVSGRLTERVGTGGALALTAVLLAFAQLGLGLAAGPFAAACAVLLRAAALGATTVLAPSVRESVLPAELLGPVTAASRIAALGAAPLGALLGGGLAVMGGLRAPYLIGAVFLAAGALVSLTMTTGPRAAGRAAPPGTRPGNGCARRANP
ncbi:MFS transporter [Streptomyces sp. NPDC006487]|uniref:MFS transporter n=1 Tax=Streptomyces sp. NPDC006487 TaxID=3364748 RepID=UPI003677C8BC